MPGYHCEIMAKGGDKQKAYTCMDRPFLVGDKVYLRPLELEDITDEYIHWINDSSVVLGRIEIRFPTTLQVQ